MLRERLKTLSGSRASHFLRENSDLQRAFFIGGSIWILGLCVNKDGASSCCGPMFLADQVVDPMGRR